MKRWTFTVIGRGYFPFDMLRYDAAFPADGSAVEVLSHQEGGRSRPWYESQKVNLVAHSSWGPTIARWNSFGWRVENIEKVGR